MTRGRETEDPRMALALCRYEVVGRYLALRPRRGTKRRLLEELASQAWTGPDGEPFSVAAETIRVWVRRYQRDGLPGLMDRGRPRRGVAALTAEQCELICDLKREVPERSLTRIIKIAEELCRVERGVLRRSTVHRVLRARGLSARASRVPDRRDLDRFEADFPNDLWQSDMLQGPWLPDPARPGKVRRAHLYAFLDDHSRLLLHGRFSFRENLLLIPPVGRRWIVRYSQTGWTGVIKTVRKARYVVYLDRLTDGAQSGRSQVTTGTLPGAGFGGSSLSTITAIPRSGSTIERSRPKKSTGGR